jgi:hypothetical protein
MNVLAALLWECDEELCIDCIIENLEKVED